MIYDEQFLRQLQGEARAAAFRLGKVLAPVQARLQAEAESFNLLTATREQCDRTLELESLLGVMEAYCEATAAYSEQLTTNLEATQNIMHAEATRAAFMARQFQLVHQDLMREKQNTSRWFDTCQQLMSQKGGEAV